MSLFDQIFFDMKFDRIILTSELYMEALGYIAFVLLNHIDHRTETIVPLKSIFSSIHQDVY